MDKIATPQELQAELRALMAFVHASTKPDRQVIASKLQALADRVAVNAPTPPEVAKLRRAVYSDSEESLPRTLRQLGWERTRVVPMSGAWWVQKGDVEVLIAFGGPRNDPAVFTWRMVDDPSVGGRFL